MSDHRMPECADDGYANIGDPDVYVRGVPHRTFKRLRDEQPVSWWDESGGSGFWALTRYADIVAASHDWKTFSASRGIRLEEMSDEELQARRSLMEMDPPEHTTYRRIVQPPFTHTEVMAAEAGIRLLARAVVEEIQGTSRFDFVDAVARRLPMRMLGKMLGIPDEDGPWLVRQGDALIGNADPEFTTHPVDLADTDAYRLRGRRPMMVTGAQLHSIPAGYWFDLRARALVHEEGTGTSAREASE